MTNSKCAMPSSFILYHPPSFKIQRIYSLPSFLYMHACIKCGGFIGSKGPRTRSLKKCQSGLNLYPRLDVVCKGLHALLNALHSMHVRLAKWWHSLGLDVLVLETRQYSVIYILV